TADKISTKNSNSQARNKPKNGGAKIAIKKATKHVRKNVMLMQIEFGVVHVGNGMFNGIVVNGV
ncbi:3388_t:CDS:1, partial [Dentiscutata heterogama]